MRPRRGGLAVLAVILVACSTDPLDVDVGDGPLIRTDASSYVLTQRDGLLEVLIPVTFENRLPQPIYLQSCSRPIPPILERKVGDEWRVAWSERVLCSSVVPLYLEPGEVYEDTIHIYAHPFGDERTPQFATADVSGTHRLQWRTALRSFDSRSRPPGEPVPLRHRVSNEFQLQGP